MIRYLSIVFILFFCNQGFANSVTATADSLLQLIQTTKQDTTKVKYYFDLMNLYASEQPKQSIQYVYKALNLSQKKKYKKGIRESYKNLFNLHYFAGIHTDTLFKDITAFEDYAIKNNDKEGLIIVYWDYAMYYGKLKKTDKELEYYIKALKTVREDPSSKVYEPHLLNNIGTISLTSGQYRKAMKYFNEGLNIVEDDAGKAHMLSNIGLCYSELSILDSALIYYDKALPFLESSNDHRGLTTLLGKKADVYMTQGKYKLSEKLFLETLEMIEKYSLGIERTQIYNALADFYAVTKKYSLSIQYGELAIEEAKTQKNYTYLEDTYAILQESYAKTGNYQKAYETKGFLHDLKDSLNNVTLLSKVEALKTEFEVEQKEAENKLLKLNLQSRKNLSIGLIIALCFAVAWGISVYSAGRQRKKYNQILEQKVAERTAELQTANKNLEQANYELRTFNYIASHDIKEPIRNIGSYVGLIFRKLPADLKASLGDYFDTIKRSSQQLYTLVEDFAKYTTLSKDEKIALETVDLNLLTKSVIETLELTIEKYNGQVVFNNLPQIQSSSSLLFTALKNLIENGLKYNQSKTPTVNIDYQETETHHQIIVSDNGIGIEPQYHEKIFEMFKRLHNRGEYEGSGIGLAIVKLAIDKLGGEVKVESIQGEGSRFILFIKAL